MSVPEKLIQSEKYPDETTSVILGQCYNEKDTTYIVRRYNAFAGQQTVINNLKVQNANLAIVVQENSELHHKQIADQQILIEQFVTIIEKSKTDPEARAFGWLYVDINELNAVLAAAKEKE